MRLLQRLDPLAHLRRGQRGKHDLGRSEEPLHVLQRKGVVPRIAFLPAVNHAVDMHPRIVGEANIVIPVYEIAHHLLRRPMPDVLLVQPLVVLQNPLCAILHHVRILDFAGLREFPFRHHLVGLDKLRPPLRWVTRIYTGKKPSLRSF